MKIYMIRHGETDFNRRGIVQGGGVDSDLNELGRQQSKAFFNHYKSIGFDAIFVSPLKRTMQTISPFVDEFNYQPRILDGLIELSWGVLEGKVPTKEESIAFQQLKVDWQNGLCDRKVEGGESPKECWERLHPVFEEFKAKHRGERILVCTHGRTSRVLLSKISTGHFADMEKYNHTNTGLNILSLDSDDQWQIEKTNDTAHLVAIESGQ